MNNNNNRIDLLREIMAVHTMLEDLQLYLNTHPADRNALAKRNSYVKQMMILKMNIIKTSVWLTKMIHLAHILGNGLKSHGLGNANQTLSYKERRL